MKLKIDYKKLQKNNMKLKNLEYPFKTKDILGYRDCFSLNKEVKSKLYFENSNLERPEISIVIPTYKAKYLKEAIESAIWQKDAPTYEILIVENDPHCDVEMMKKWLISQEKKVFRFYCNEKNIGMTGNWNRCIELAKSDNIVFLHSDDWMVYDCLHNLWNIHKKVESNAAILGHEHRMDAKRNIISWYKLHHSSFFLRCKSFYKTNHYSMFMLDTDNGCCEMINKKVAMQLGGFNDFVYPGIDHQFFSRYMSVVPLYRGNFVVRCCRMADVSNSIKVVSLYRADDYYQRCAIISSFFKCSFFLKYISYLKAKNAFYPDWGDNNVKYKLKWYEKIVLYLNDKIYFFIMNYI